MKRIYYSILILAISMMACSIGGGNQTVDEGQEAPQSTKVIQGYEENTSDQQPEQLEARPELPVVETGDCEGGIGPDANLAKCDLTDLNLSGSNLSGANLAQADLSISNLSEVDFNSANLVGATIKEANMSSANFSNADLTNANLSESNLIGADFTGAITIGVDFHGCNITGAIITKEQLGQSFSVAGAVLPDGSIGK